jgi:predicted CXXCH cytochrome family protein
MGKGKIYQFIYKIFTKRPAFLLFISLLISFFFFENAHAQPPPVSGIRATNHNLSVSGPGTIKATSETEVCVFCHIPHNANPAVPLWNHSVSGAAYTMYNSEYLQRANYDIPSTLGTYPSTGYRSRLCLSCHDGTVAIGNVYILRGELMTSPINMQGVTANGTLPTTSTAYIGTDLTNDHPVAIKYDTTKTITFGVGSRNMELASAPPINPKPYQNIKLFNPSPGYVECPSCHDPHIENEKFLVIWNTNLGTTIADMCTTCHDKINWSTSDHSTSSASYTDTDVQTNYGVNTISALECTNCHQAHGGQGSPYWYILHQIEETTCFRGAASASTGAPCHGTGAAPGGKVIETLFSRSYKHPVTTISGEHTGLDVLDPSYIDWATDKHAECVDCHNPHQAKSTPVRVDATSWYPSTVNSNSNLVSNSGPLTGVTGVEPSTEPSSWSPPTSYTTYNEATKEYQICFKCHSYYALQDADGVTAYTTASGAIITDQAMEFNMNNKSVHPVRVGLNSQTGSYAPKALESAQLKSPWNVNVGTQTMYCSDCHGADSENSTDPKGPHGSMAQATSIFLKVLTNSGPWGITRYSA